MIKIPDYERLLREEFDKHTGEFPNDRLEELIQDSLDAFERSLHRIVSSQIWHLSKTNGVVLQKNWVVSINDVIYKVVEAGTNVTVQNVFEHSDRKQISAKSVVLVVDENQNNLLFPNIK
jgi:hypothetical protein